MHFYGSVEATGVEPVSSDRDYASYVCNLSGDLPGSAVITCALDGMVRSRQEPESLPILEPLVGFCG